VHTGEYQRAGPEVRGVAVHVAARVMASGGADEVRVSAATAALLDPSGFSLRSLGPHELKGVPGLIELYAVSQA
jgi:class 3 adenylate cyclase